MAVLTLKGTPYPKQIDFFTKHNKFIGYGGS